MRFIIKRHTNVGYKADNYEYIFLIRRQKQNNLANVRLSVCPYTKTLERMYIIKVRFHTHFHRKKVSIPFGQNGGET